MDGTGQTRALDREQIDQLPDDPQELARVLQRIAGESPTGEPMGITVNGVPGGQMPRKEDIKSRYLLTYSPRGVSSAGWHPIEVKLKNRRGQVTARRGYWR
jgi:hypothetical protein